MSYKELGAKGLFLIQNEPGGAIGQALIPTRLNRPSPSAHVPLPPPASGWA